MHTAPAFLSDVDCRLATGKIRTCPHNAAGGNGTIQAPITARIAAQPGSQTTQVQGSIQPLSGARPVLQPGNRQPAVRCSSPTAKTHHLYLCIKTGGGHIFTELKVADFDTDISIFSKLKTSYLDSRKGLLSWVSWWRYSHCDFYRVRPQQHQRSTSTLTDSSISLSSTHSAGHRTNQGSHLVMTWTMMTTPFSLDLSDRCRQ